MDDDQARRLARLHLGAAHALYRARELADLSVRVISNRTGLTTERLMMVEEGDTTSLTEVALMCDAIGISMTEVFADLAKETDPA